MRAVIREILARRMPEPPEAFVAIQVSRLNEALLVAFGAMTGANLKAVDRVVRIVRELDRYHGFQTAVGRRPRLKPVAERAITFGAEPDDRPAIPLQDLGKIDSALGILAIAAASDTEPARSRAPAEPVPAVSPSCAEPDSRPEIPPQDLGKADSAPGILTVAQACDADLAPAETVPAASLRCAAPTERPEIPAQPLEKAQSAPGTERPPEEANAPGGPIGLDPTATSPGGPRFCNVRMTPNGIAAC